MKVGILIITHSDIGKQLLLTATSVFGRNPFQVEILSVDNYDQPNDVKELAEKYVNFLDNGNISNSPVKSVANPGKININAAKANAAPDTISYKGTSFFISCEIPDLRVLKPSYRAYQTPTKAVNKISEIVLNAPI